MSIPIQCPDCGAELPADRPKGLCACCALKGAMEVGTEEVPSPGTRVSSLPRAFGDYELLEEIARGGMGVVYKARQMSLGRFVAVKMLLFGAHASADFIRRFRIEASATAALQHPNIVAIHEVGVKEGEHFLTMDYVDGPNLAQFVKEQSLAPRRAAQYLKTIAEAIHYAHEKGILHRDLKPSNVLIDANDQPRVTDFGLAKRLNVGSQASSSAAQLTQSGHMLGSPGYMSPEQATGVRHKVGRGSDVYSLGSMLYHMLTGRPPFGGGSLAETLHQLQHQEPVSPHLLNPGVPRDLETVCMKCLEKDPARRYHTTQELADELGRFLRNEAIRTRPASAWDRLRSFLIRRPTFAALLATSGLAAMALVAVGVGAAYNAKLNQINLRLQDALNEAERQRLRAQTAEARRNAEICAQAVQRAMEAAADSLHAIRAVFSDAEAPVEPDEFHGLARSKMHSFRGIDLLAWLPRITPADLPKLTKTKQQWQGTADFQIRALDGTPRLLEPAAKDIELVPIFYVEAIADQTLFEGLDLGLDPDCAIVMKKSQEADEALATGPITVLKKKLDCLVFLPVRSGSDAEPFLGFAVASFNLRVMVQAALEGLLPLDVGVLLFDETDRTEGRLVYASRQPQAQRGMREKKTFHSAGRTWSLVILQTWSSDNP